MSPLFDRARSLERLGARMLLLAAAIGLLGLLLSLWG
jgi:hypothetical protein